jgi:hypothetical protein
MAVEWDENSHFFHSATNERRRKNAIPILENGGAEFNSHEVKAFILFDFYKGLLGSSAPVEWRFHLSELYPSLDVAGMGLTDPFSPNEITTILFAMDHNSSLGLNGFGPSFYRAFWPLLKPVVQWLFDAVFNGTIDLDGLNRAHLFLLPKREGVRRADEFRPIPLQNCPMKLFSKVMANRLRNAIPLIVDADQTGFVHGRSIAENLIYAVDLLSCCHKRGVPTTVLKLDFCKAFDSVNWDNLDTIL